MSELNVHKDGLTQLIVLELKVTKSQSESGDTAIDIDHIVVRIKKRNVAAA